MDLQIGEHVIVEVLRFGHFGGLLGVSGEVCVEGEMREVKISALRVIDFHPVAR